MMCTVAGVLSSPWLAMVARSEVICPTGNFVDYAEVFSFIIASSEATRQSISRLGATWIASAFAL
jgi:hypothetical protein